MRKPPVLLAGCLAGFAALGLPGDALPAGFYLQEQSVSALGTAYAGSAVMTRDASILYYNPAGMTGLGRAQIYAGADYIRPRANMTDNGSTVLGAPAGGPDSNNPVPAKLLPNIYAAMPVMNGPVWAGAGVAVPFGMGTEYDSGWHGRFDSIKSDLRTFEIHASLAAPLTDWLSAGASLIAQQVDAELTSAATNGVTEGLSVLGGDDASAGWAAGIIIRPLESTEIGLHYRSEIHHRLEGRAIVSGVAGLNENSRITAGLDLPDIASLGLAHRCTDRLTMMAQATWFGWNDFAAIRAVRADGSLMLDQEQNYQSTLNLSLGGEYQWSEDTVIRAGYQFDETPTTDQFRTTRTPDGDRQWFTMGAGHDIGDNISIDIGAAWIAMDDAEVDVMRNGGLARVRVGREDSSVGILSFAVNYRF